MLDPFAQITYSSLNLSEAMQTTIRTVLSDLSAAAAAPIMASSDAQAPDDRDAAGARCLSLKAKSHSSTNLLEDSLKAQLSAKTAKI